MHKNCVCSCVYRSILVFYYIEGNESVNYIETEHQHMQNRTTKSERDGATEFWLCAFIGWHLIEILAQTHSIGLNVWIVHIVRKKNSTPNKEKNSNISRKKINAFTLNFSFFFFFSLCKSINLWLSEEKKTNTVQSNKSCKRKIEKIVSVFLPQIVNNTLIVEQFPCKSHFTIQYNFKTLWNHFFFRIVLNFSVNYG